MLELMSIGLFMSFNEDWYAEIKALHHGMLGLFAWLWNSLQNSHKHKSFSIKKMSKKNTAWVCFVFWKPQHKSQERTVNKFGTVSSSPNFPLSNCSCEFSSVKQSAASVHKKFRALHRNFHRDTTPSQWAASQIHLNLTATFLRAIPWKISTQLKMKSWWGIYTHFSPRFAEPTCLFIYLFY